MIIIFTKNKEAVNVSKNYYYITLALAVICQSARLVQQLAHQGHCDADALHVSLNSIIDMNPSSTLAVFGGSEATLTRGIVMPMRYTSHSTVLLI